MRYYRWERARGEIKHYRRREPERSALYQLVFNTRDTLPLVWEERFQPVYGVLRDEALKAFDEYLNCGLLCHGAARAYCDTCKHSLLVAFSCKKRGICPSCQAKRAVMFAEHLYNSVLQDVPHRHTVFTIPKRLRAYFKYDRGLYRILFGAAWGALSGSLGKGAAAVLTLQTAGEALNFHPHLHGIMADGTFTPDGFAPLTHLDTDALSSDFADRILYALRTEGLISSDTELEILSQEHSGFSVWAGEPFCDEQSEKFVARYIERGPHRTRTREPREALPRR